MAFIRPPNKINHAGEIAGELAEIYPRLWRFARVTTGRPDSADDLAQAACLSALEKSAQFQPGTNLVHWVFTIAHRIWLNELRAAAVRRGKGLVAVEDADLQDTAPTGEANIFVAEVLKRHCQLIEP